MSYILDALKRAEHERNGALATSPTREAAARGLAGLSPLLLILIGVSLFAAGIGISWWLLRPASPEAQTAVATPAVPATAAPTMTPTAAPASTPAAAAPATPVTEAGIAPATEAIDENTELLGDAAEIEPALAGYESLDDLTPVFQGAAVGAGTATPATQTGAARRSTGTTIKGFTPPSAPAAPVHLEPSLRDMPQAYRDQFPALTVQVHVHNDAPDKRWIMVEGRRYGEGSQLDSGPQIVEIAADGIIFSYRNERVFWPLNR
jgi:general secretion pathway protein B